MNLHIESNGNSEKFDEQTKPVMDELQKVINNIENLEKNDQDETDNTNDINELEKEEFQSQVEKPEIDSDEDSEPPSEVKKNKEDKIWKLKRDKYKILAEKEEAEKRIRELESLLDESLSATTYHYGKSAYEAVERAKIQKKIAIENGDADALVDADEALYKALYEVKELERFENKERYSPNKVETNQNESSELYNEIAQDWLETHPELDPKSRYYQPQLAQNVWQFANTLDQDLMKNNRMDLFFSPDYFETLNNYIRNNQKEIMRNEARTTRSSGYNSYVGGVRNSHTANSLSGSARRSKSPELTEEEKTWSKELGISEAEWLKYKTNE